MYGKAIQPAATAKPDEVVLHEQTRVVEVFMAGDIHHAKQVIRRYCKDSPICVTVSQTSFIYRGGEETGFVVGFRNYPRFPSDSYSLRTAAFDLAVMLRNELCQDSYMVVDAAGMTTWSSDRNA